MYKIMDVAPNGDLRTLFHGINGSRVVPQNVDIKANVKDGCRDGSGKRTYTSGWHTVETLDQAHDYLRFFWNLSNKVIVECTISGKTWKKAHSRVDYVWLSEFINLGKIVWRYLEHD